jgi:Mg-chelatase subunit ChlD
MIIFCMLVLPAVMLRAQTQARITAITAVQNQSQATAQVRLICKGNPYYNLQSGNIALTDNGDAVQQITLENSASALTRKPFTAMFVLDVSGSMAGPALAALKAAAHTFVSFMDTTTDSLGIVAFSTQPHLVMDCTPDAWRLRSSIDSLTAVGATALWDACMLGQLVIYGHGNAAQALIIITDGNDNSSYNNAQFLIQKANMFNLRCFTIGLGSGVYPDELQAVAVNTGGEYYYAPTPAELSTIFLDIASFTRRGFDEYTIRYNVPDPTAARHVLTATVRLCDTLVSGTATRPSLHAVTPVDAPPTEASNFVLESIAPHPICDGVLHASYVLGADGVRGEPVTVRLFDALGRCVLRAQGYSGEPGRHLATVSVQHLPSGVYLLQATHGAATVTRRVTIMR